jgi:transposase
MRDLNYFTKIYLASKPVDFRNQMQGLSVLVKSTLDKDPLQGRCLFVFVNRRKTSVKLLYWDLTGFAMWVKTLEKDRFRWPKQNESSSFELASRDLKWLLEGIDISKIKKHEELNYTRIY